MTSTGCYQVVDAGHKGGRDQSGFVYQEAYVAMWDASTKSLHICVFRHCAVDISLIDSECQDPWWIVSVVKRKM